MSLALLVMAALPAAAQFGPRTDVGPELFLRKKLEDKPAKPPPIAPFAAALHDAFPKQDWTRIGLSTASARRELSRLVRQGYYRLELTLLAEAARKSDSKLEDLVKKRSDGESLRKIAEGLDLDYFKLLRESDALKRRLDGKAKIIKLEAIEASSAAASAPTAVSTGAPSGGEGP